MAEVRLFLLEEDKFAKLLGVFSLQVCLDFILDFIYSHLLDESNSLLASTFDKLVCDSAKL